MLFAFNLPFIISSRLLFNSQKANAFSKKFLYISKILTFINPYTNLVMITFSNSSLEVNIIFGY
jgi:hypothetical protein